MRVETNRLTKKSPFRTIMYSKVMVYMADLAEDVLPNIMHKIRIDVMRFVTVNRGEIPEMKQKHEDCSKVL